MRLSVLIAALLTVFGSVPAQAADVPAGWQTYSGRGFSIGYPAGWTVNPNFVEKGYRFFQGDMDDKREGVAFSPSYDLAPGTTLQSNQLTLAVMPARPGDLCTAAGFLLDPPPDYFTRRVVDKPEAVQTIAEAGDLYIIEHVIVMASKKPCLAVHYTIVYAREQRGAADAPKPFNREQLFNLLNAIGNTLKPAP